MRLQKRFYWKSNRQFEHQSGKFGRNARFEFLEPRLCLNGTCEIHGMAYDASVLPAGDQPLAGVKIYLDLNANDEWNDTEPWTVTDGDGEYAFTGLEPGTYTVAEIIPVGYMLTYPAGGTHSVTLSTEDIVYDRDFGNEPGLPTMVDVFILGDDTGSFGDTDTGFFSKVMPIINSLVTEFPSIDWAFGIGRILDYSDYIGSTVNERPFVLNQPMIEFDNLSFDDSIEFARTRTAPGRGGDYPEAITEALYQTATGLGFDGNNNDSTYDSGYAGQYETQVSPGSSGDVPSFDPFKADSSCNVLEPAGTLGGVGFRTGALSIVLAATDNGTGYEPEDPPLLSTDDIEGINDVEYGEFIANGRGSTPDVDGDSEGDGAKIQETVAALNGLGINVIGLGKGDLPRSMLEAFAKATGAVHEGATTIENGTEDPIATGDPLYYSLDTNAYDWTDEDLCDNLAAGIASQLVIQPSVLGGTVWKDLDDDGLRESGEPLMSGVTVYLDTDEDGELDSGEYRTTTDGSGQYAFTNVVPGTYCVCVDLPSGYGYTPPDFSAEVVLQSETIISNADIGIQEITAVEDSLQTDEDTPLDIPISSLMANDLEEVPSTENPVSFHDFTQPEHGTLSQDGNILEYVPEADWYGVDTFNYCLTDGSSYYDWAAVTVTVNPVNDAPRINTEFLVHEGQLISGVLVLKQANADG